MDTKLDFIGSRVSPTRIPKKLISTLRRQGNIPEMCNIGAHFGHMIMNYRLRNSRGKFGPWKSTGLVCFICHKYGRLAQKCKYRQVSNEDNKGKTIVVNQEQVRNDMKKIWVKKEENDAPRGNPSSSGHKVSSSN